MQKDTDTNLILTQNLKTLQRRLSILHLIVHISFFRHRITMNMNEKKKKKKDRCSYPNALDMDLSCEK